MLTAWECGQRKKGSQGVWKASQRKLQAWFAAKQEVAFPYTTDSFSEYHGVQSQVHWERELSYQED